MRAARAAGFELAGEDPEEEWWSALLRPRALKRPTPGPGASACPRTASSAASSRGEIPGEQVYQDDAVVAFRDIHPQAPVHVLVVPREHVAAVGELGDEHRDARRPPAHRRAAGGGRRRAAWRTATA